jgi:hypothetical protein
MIDQGERCHLGIAWERAVACGAARSRLDAHPPTRRTVSHWGDEIVIIADDERGHPSPSEPQQH